MVARIGSSPFELRSAGAGGQNSDVRKHRGSNLANARAENQQGRLDRVRLYESPDLFVDCTSDRMAQARRIARGNRERLKISLTRRYRFRRRTGCTARILSEEENQRVYGKCAIRTGMGTTT